MKVQFFVGLLMVSLAGALSAQTCTVTTSGTAFGAYSGGATQPRDTSGTILVTCKGSGENNQLSYTIKLSLGGGTLSLRKMTSGKSSLTYDLYTDVARTQLWGDGTGGTTYVSDSVTLVNSGSTKTYTVYGRIPTGPDHISARSLY